MCGFAEYRHLTALDDRLLNTSEEQTVAVDYHEPLITAVINPLIKMQSTRACTLLKEIFLF